MNSPTNTERRFPWLEVVLGITFVLLVFQLFPSLWSSIWSGLFWAGNITNWTRQTWRWFFVAICTVCVVIRFAPDVWQAWREGSVAQGQRRAHAEHARQLKEARERREAIEEGRRRRIY